MGSWVRSFVVFAVAFVLGWLAHATPNGVVAAAATSAPATSAASCQHMQQMMQQAKSPADKALMQAMMGMHHSMMDMQLTGDADHDFLVMMIPHHQGAIEMARVELQYGKDAKVRELAQNVLSAQQKEITEMESWLKSGTP